MEANATIFRNGNKFLAITSKNVEIIISAVSVAIKMVATIGIFRVNSVQHQSQTHIFQLQLAKRVLRMKTIANTVILLL